MDREKKETHIMTPTIEKMKAPIILVVAFVVAAMVLVGCSDNSDQQGSNQKQESTQQSSGKKGSSQQSSSQQSSGLVQTVEKDISSAKTFKKMFLDYPNPGPTGPVSSGYDAAGHAPLSGSTSLIPQEQRCIAKLDNPGWFKTMSPSEHADSARTHLAPCASYTGETKDNNNQVYTYKTPTKLGGSIYDAVTGDPQHLYAYGGGDGSLMKSGLNQGHFLASLDARTLKIEWKTVLDNANVSGQWNVLSGVNYPSDGNLFVGYGGRLAKIDPDTGEVLANIELPTGPADAKGLNFETIIAAPDGTIITKSQTRPATKGTSSSSSKCTEQGFNAMNDCKGKQPNTEVVAVNPDTMKVLDAITLPQEVGGRNPLSVYKGHVYTYLTGNTNVLRAEWDPDTQQLTYDKSWYPSYLKKGQGPGAAPCIMGKWVVFNTNAAPAKVPLSVVAINQGDPKDLHRIEPLPLGDSPVSVIPSMIACDTENNLIYTVDFGPGTLAAVKLDPKTGELTKVWGPVDQRTFSFTTLIGPKDERVVVGTNIKVTNPDELKDITYTEQMVWRDAATGDVLARSNYVDAMTQGNLPTPGYGGLMYMLQQYGDITAFQVLPGSEVPNSAK